MLELGCHFGDYVMATLQIPDLDQETITRLRQWAANHGRTLEDEARVVLQRIMGEAVDMPIDSEKTPSNTASGECRNRDQEEQSRAALSLQR